MSPLEILVVVVAVVAGSMVQATAGVGITLVAAPVLLAVDPAFVPLPLILVAFSLRVAALPGPPYAILHHDDPPEVLRPNISALVLVLAGTISIRLLVGGEVTGADLGRVALVMGSALVGLLLAPPLRRWVDSGWFRPALLSVCGLGGLATALGAIL